MHPAEYAIRSNGRERQRSSPAASGPLWPREVAWRWGTRRTNRHRTSHPPESGRFWSHLPRQSWSSSCCPPVISAFGGCVFRPSPQSPARRRHGKPSLVNTSMLPGAVSSALACVWSIQSSLLSKFFAIVGAEKTAARAAKATATQTGRVEPRLFMTTIPTNQRRLSNTAGNDCYPSKFETARGNSVSTDSWKNTGQIPPFVLLSAPTTSLGTLAVTAVSVKITRTLTPSLLPTSADPPRGDQPSAD
jgi:hypothetical protein